MKHRVRTAIGAVAAALLPLAAVVAQPAASAAEPAFLTLVLGRTQWVSTEGCTSMPGTIDLGQVADELEGRGLTATGLVVTTATQESTRYCQSNIGLHATWADLATLRDDYGWTFDSTGAQHRNMLDLTPQQQLAESCGSLTALRNHGHNRSGSLFGYPNNNYDATMQANVVSTCFDFGRRYILAGDPSVTTPASAEAEGGLQWTLTINGNMPARYTPRERIAELMNPAPGEWAVVQAYRFVTGARSGAGSSWDCTSADPAAHWTSRAELYCWDDYTWALDRIGADIVVTDPRTVADAWFDDHPVPDTQAPSPSVAAPANAATVASPVQFTGSATDDVGVTQVEIAIRNNATLQWWTGSGWGAFRYNPVTVASPGSSSTAWSYALSPPAGGNYGYQVRARDAAGNISPPTAWRTFRTS
ncbi:MAG TPA: Ig-like domain-containing protein [Actinomycetota bacterium]